VEKVVAVDFSESRALKDNFLAIDKRLALDDASCLKAAAFLLENNLDSDYLLWLRDQCENKDYHSFAGLFYTLLLKKNKVEEYKASLIIPDKPPPKLVNCPACNETHSLYDEKCPSCGLPEYSKPEIIFKYRQLHELAPEKRAEYWKREDDILVESGYDPEKFRFMSHELNKEFGLLPSA
jgi:hypothetical protein